MNRLERWVRVHILRQRRTYYEVSLEAEGITVIPMTAEFIDGRNVDDLTFGPLVGEGTVSGVWIGEHYIGLGDVPTSGGESVDLGDVDIDLNRGWFRV